MDIYERTPLSYHNQRNNSSQLDLEMSTDQQEKVRFIDNATELLGCDTQTEFINVDLQQSQTQTEFLATKSPQRK